MQRLWHLTLLLGIMQGVQRVHRVQAIASNDLVVEDFPLSLGSFKNVWKATWARRGHKDEQQVVVIVLKQASSAARVIKTFEKLGPHAHLVKLLAVSKWPPAGHMCILIEFAQRGSMDEVLNQMSESGESPTHAVLLRAASQVCARLYFQACVHVLLSRDVLTVHVYACMHVCVCVCLQNSQLLI